MASLYSQEHAAYRDLVERWIARMVTPRLSLLDQEQVLSKEASETFLAAIDADGMISVLPRDENGKPDWTAFGILLEQLARASASVAHLVVFKLASIEFSAPLFSEEQRVAFARYLDGGVGVAGGFTETGAGSNPGEMRTIAVRRGNDWVINGGKIWISAATHAESILVSCRTREEGQPDGFGLFFVERRHGWTARNIEMMGLSMHPTCEVTFDDVVVPDIARLAPAGNALGQVQQILCLARCFMATMSVGIAQAALDAALAFACQREQFGRKIAGFQLVQDMLVSMATDVDCGRLLAYRAIDSVMTGTESLRLDSSMAKMFCTEMCVRVASNGIQVHGGMGLARETGVERIFRDARMMTIPDGTTQIQKLIIGRELTGISALR